MINPLLKLPIALNAFLFFFILIIQNNTYSENTNFDCTVAIKAVNM